MVQRANTEHPLISPVKKGAGSEKTFIAALEEFRPHVESKQELLKFVRAEISNAMRSISPLVFSQYEEPAIRQDAILRSSRRRVAAALDAILVSEEKLSSWEQFIYPPFGPDLCMGDVIQVSGADSSDPASFRLVLTPSCDLANSGGRTAKVTNVLVARCVSCSTGLLKLNLPKKVEKAAEKLRDTLSTGFKDDLLPIPELHGVLPSMTAKLKDLELIPLSDIGDNCPFVPIASIDSPFREMVAWAYMQTSCRPGLPERDFKSWGMQIAKSMNNNPETDPQHESH